MRAEVEKIIYKVIAAENETRQVPIDYTLRERTRLYGDGGQLDSMDLVSLVIALEQTLEGDLGVCVALASERAVSSRASPFASVASLTDHIMRLAAAQEATRV